ncbi:hypothetical protein [Deinococcus cavernae]|nr:hypothetical protein [Deinococcus cavernae]
MLSESDLEKLLREHKQAFDAFIVLGWYDGVLSALATINSHRVALYLEAVWSDCAFPEMDTYLYRLSQLAFDEVAGIIKETSSRWEYANSEVLDEVIADAMLQNLLVSLTTENLIHKVWRPVEGARGLP